MLAHIVDGKDDPGGSAASVTEAVVGGVRRQRVDAAHE